MVIVPQVVMETVGVLLAFVEGVQPLLLFVILLLPLLFRILFRAAGTTALRTCNTAT